MQEVVEEHFCDLGLHIQQDPGLSFSISCCSGKSFLKLRQGGAPLTTLGDSHLHGASSPSQETAQWCPPQSTALSTGYITWQPSFQAWALGTAPLFCILHSTDIS